MYPRVKEVKPLEDYNLFIKFTNGEAGILNIGPYRSFGKEKLCQ